MLGRFGAQHVFRLAIPNAEYGLRIVCADYMINWIRGGKEVTITLDQVYPDEGFKRTLPALGDEQLRELEANILEAGKVRDKLIVWKDEGYEGYALVDGYNRLDIYEHHTDELPAPLFDELKGLRTRDEVRLWLKRHHYGRRHFTPQQLSEYRAELYESLKQQRGGDRRSEAAREKSKDQNDPLIGAAATVAKETGVSEPTIKRDAKYKQALDCIRQVNSKAADDIRDGRLKMPRPDVIAMSKLVDMGPALINIRNDRKWDDDGKPATPPPKQDGSIKDATGRVVPQRLTEAFTAVPRFNGLVQQIGKLLNNIDELARSPGSELLIMPQVRADLRNVQTALRAARPHAVCPYCKGKACKKCIELGWISRDCWAGIPEERR